MESTLRSLIKAIDAFTPISGLKVNHDKTQVLMLGKKVKTDTKICPDLNLNYVTRLKVLGHMGLEGVLNRKKTPIFFVDAK